MIIYLYRPSWGLHHKSNGWNGPHCVLLQSHPDRILYHNSNSYHSPRRQLCYLIELEYCIIFRTVVICPIRRFSILIKLECCIIVVPVEKGQTLFKCLSHFCLLMDIIKPLAKDRAIIQYFSPVMLVKMPCGSCSNGPTIIWCFSLFWLQMGLLGSVSKWRIIFQCFLSVSHENALSGTCSKEPKYYLMFVACFACKWPQGICWGPDIIQTFLACFSCKWASWDPQKRIKHYSNVYRMFSCKWAS